MSRARGKQCYGRQRGPHFSSRPGLSDVGNGNEFVEFRVLDDKYGACFNGVFQFDVLPQGLSDSGGPVVIRVQAWFEIRPFDTNRTLKKYSKVYFILCY